MLNLVEAAITHPNPNSASSNSMGESDMRVLVTGHKGFLGRHFCSRYDAVPFEDDAGTVDLRDADRVRHAIGVFAPKAVLHLAAQSSVAASFVSPDTTLAVNFTGTLNLLRALKAEAFSGVFLYVGSADVYGYVPEANLPTQEIQPLRPRSPYAVSKVAAEALCYQWSQTEKFRLVLVRPFSQIGPGQDARFAVAGFARQIAAIKKGKAPPALVTGDLGVTRDFTDVRDTVCALRALLDSGVNGEVYNICSGRESLLSSMVQDMLRIAGVSAEMHTDPERLRPNEQRRMLGDPGKIAARTGWLPKIPMAITLADILQDAEEKIDDK